MQIRILVVVVSSLLACARGGFVDVENQPPAVPDPIPAEPQPKFGVTVSLDDAPPPIAGGTLEVSPDETFAIAADADRDRAYVVMLAQPPFVWRTVELQKHDEPGRVAIDGSWRAHVILRGAGALLTFDASTGEILARRAVCPSPRGLAWDEIADVVHVACMDGDLVTLPAAGGPPIRTVHVVRDLRDVAVIDGAVFVSTFRTGVVMRLAGDGTIVWSNVPPVNASGSAIPSAARRMRAVGGAIWVMRQKPTAFVPRIRFAPKPYYGTPCQPLVATEFMRINPSGGGRAIKPTSSGFIVDFAAISTASAERVVVVAAGNGHTPSMRDFGALDEVSNCGDGVPTTTIKNFPTSNRELVAAARIKDATLLLQREPASLVVQRDFEDTPTVVPLSDISREDTGHAVFHSNTGDGIACASCHLEGDTDGVVWTMPDPRTNTFDKSVPLRTQTLLGTIAGTAPYHWAGDIADMSALADDVYMHGMGGARLTVDQKAALTRWIERLPAPPPRRSDDAAIRGQALFAGRANCASCHAGEKMTDNTAHDVGAFMPLQTPSLVGLGSRWPLMHDGCAKTVAERFAPKCRADKHGFVPLTADEMNDLLSFLNGL